MRMRLGLLLGLGMLLVASDARAGAITVSQLVTCVGSASCVIGTSTVSAFKNSTTTGLISSQTLNGYTGFGVGGGAVNGEIDGQEFLQIDFGGLVTLDSLQLVFLYNPPAWGDVEYGSGEDETAEIEAFNGNVSLGTRIFNVLTDNTASVSGGSYVMLSSGAEANAGVWSWLNPYGATSLTRLRIRSGDPGLNATYSDVAIGNTSFTSTSTVPVPEPASLLLLGVGVVALGLRRLVRA